jgi:hypothetical protein
MRLLLKLRAFFVWLWRTLRRAVRWLTKPFSKTETDPMTVLSANDPLYLHPHAAANEPVTLHEGPIAVQGGMTGSGKLILRWQPSTGLRLEADMDSVHAPQPGARLPVDVAGSTTEVLFGSLHMEVSAEKSFARVSGSASRFAKGTPTGLKSIGFQVVNFNDFFTPGVYMTPTFGFPPQVAELQHGGWRIRLTAVPGFKEIFESVGEAGGYVFTHVGRLERTDGSLFDAPDAEAVLDALRRFLSFARGAATSLPVWWGTAPGGSVVWEQWGGQPVDPWKGRDTWFDEQHGNLLSELFDTFAQTKADPDTWEPFSLALHWFQSCNIRAGGMEGSIILGLTALDLLSAMVVVDRTGVMTEGQFESRKTTHKGKLAALLNVLKVPQAIPAKYVELAAFATANGWSSAAEALTEIRHGYVHSSKKRRKVVLSAPNIATFQAWQLSLWYQELALLFLLNHQGHYRNRVTAGWLGEVEKVPWV